MGLWDMFTGGSVKKAADQAKATLDQYGRQVGDVVGQARTTGLEGLQTGLYGALPAWRTATGTARGDISGSLPGAQAALTGGAGLSADAIREMLGLGTSAIGGATGTAASVMEGLGREGLGALRSGVGSAVSSYDPMNALAAAYGGRATDASDAIRRALGIGGQPANTADFMTNPAYQFNLTQGLDAINRAAQLRGGSLQGGNIDRAAQEYGAGLASREFGDYIGRLQAQQALYAPLESQLTAGGATGRAGAYTTGGTQAADLLSKLGLNTGQLIGTAGTNIANLAAGAGGRLSDVYGITGRSLADLETTGGKNLADIAMKGGAGEASLYSGYGQSLADLVSKLSSQQIGFLTPTAQASAQADLTKGLAEMQGSSNLWNALGNVATFGAKAFGLGGFGAPVKG